MDFDALEKEYQASLKSDDEADTADTVDFDALEQEYQGSLEEDSADEPRKSKRKKKKGALDNVGRIVKDTAVTVAKGTSDIVGAGLGLSELSQGSRLRQGIMKAIGKPADTLSPGWVLEKTTGYTPKKADEALEEMYSDEQQAANQQVEEAHGFVGKAKEMIENPSTIYHGAVRSVPSSLAGGVVGRAVAPAFNAVAPRVLAKVAPKLASKVDDIAAPVAGAFGEGLIGTGQSIQSIKDQTPGGDISDTQLALGVASGIGTGLFSVIGNRISQKAGLADIDTMLISKGAKETKKGVARRMIEGGFTESVLEELPQGIQEQIFMNAATDKPLLHGVPEGMAQSILTALPMGASVNALSRKSTPDEQGPKSSTTPVDLDSAIGLHTEPDKQAFTSGASSDDIVQAKSAEQENAILKAAREAEAQQIVAEQQAAQAEAENQAKAEQVQAQQTQDYKAKLATNQNLQQIFDATEDLSGTLSVTSNLLHTLEQTKTGGKFTKVTRKAHEALTMYQRAVSEGSDPSGTSNVQALQKIQYELQDYGFNTNDQLEKLLIGRLDMFLGEQIAEAQKAYEMDVPKGTRKPDILPSETDNKPVGRGLFRYGEPVVEQGAKDAQQNVIKLEPSSYQDPHAEFMNRPTSFGPDESRITQKEKIDAELQAKEQTIAHRKATSPIGLAALHQRIASENEAKRQKKESNDRALSNVRAAEEGTRSSGRSADTIQPTLLKDQGRTLSGFPKSITQGMKNLDPTNKAQVAETERVMLERVKGSTELNPVAKAALTERTKKFFTELRSRQSSGENRLKLGKNPAAPTGKVRYSMSAVPKQAGPATSAKELNQRWEKAGVRNAVLDKGDTMELLSVEVPHLAQHQGVGTRFVRELTNLADATGKTVKLLASPLGVGKGKSATSTEAKRLRKFYEGHGFAVTKAEEDGSGYWMERPAVRYAKTSAKKKGKFTKHSTQIIYDAINQVQSMSKKVAKVVVVERQEDLPESAHESRMSGRTDAMWDEATDTVYFVAENIPSAKRAVELWLHEQVGHKGLLKLFADQGADFNEFLDFAYNTVKKNKKLFNDVAKLYKDKSLEDKSLNEQERKSKEQDQKRLIVEEIIARRAEKLNPFARKQIFQRFLDFMNKWLGHITGYSTDPIRVTMKDIDTLLEAAKNKLIHDEYRDWLEFRENDDVYIAALKEVAEKSPKALTWYRNHHKLVDDVFGDDAPIVHAVLGVMSQAVSVKANGVFFAKSFLYLAGKLDKPGGRFPNAVREKLDAFAKGDISALAGKAVKIDEFLRSLFGDLKGTTNDRWMHRAFFGPAMLTWKKLERMFAYNAQQRLLKKKGLVKTAGTIGPDELDAHFSVDENTASRHKLFDLAQRMTDETGRQWHPVEVQAALWVYRMAKDEGKTLEDASFDYNDTLTRQSPALDGMTPIEYLRKHLGDELGQLHKRIKLPLATLFPRVSKLEKQYLRYLKKKGVKQIDTYSTEPGVDLGMGVHYSEAELNEGNFLIATPADDPMFMNNHSRSDIFNRQEEGKRYGAVAPYAELVYFYEAGSQPEVQLASKKKVYNVSFKGAKIYDAVSDALDLWETANNILSKELARKSAETAKRAGLNPGQVRTGNPTTAALTNMVAKMIQEEGYDGFVTRAPTGLRRGGGQGRWVLMFKQKAIEHVTTSGAVGISDVVESIEKGMPQDIGDASKIMKQRAEAFQTRTMEISRNYNEVRIDRWDPAVARFGEATSGSLEVSSAVTMTGPIPALRALLAEVGIENAQRQIYLMHTKGTPNGTMIKMKVNRKFKDYAKLKAELESNGLTNFNLTSNGFGDIYLEQFVGDWDSDVLDKLNNLYDIVGDTSIPFEQTRICSDILGDPEGSADIDAALHGYKKDLIEYFGQQKGNEIYDHAIERREARLKDLRAKNAGVPKKGQSGGSPTPQGLGTGNNPTPGQPRVRFSKAFRHLNLRETPEGFVSHLKHYASATTSWFKDSWASLFDGRLGEALFDDLARVQQIEEGQDLAPSMSGWKSLRMMRSLGAIMGTMLREGTLVYDQGNHHVRLGERDGGLLKPFEKMDQKTFARIKARLLAERVDSLLKSKKLDQKILDRIYGDDEDGNVIDPRAYTDEVLNDTADLAKDSKYNEVVQHLKKYNNAMLDLLEKSGIIGADKRAEWEQFATYVPLNRILDKDDHPEVHASPIFSKAATVSGPKAFKGSAGYQIGDPLDNLMANYTYLTNEAMRNTAFKKVFNAAKSVGLMVHEQIPRSMAMQRRGRDIITIKVGGKEQYIRCDDTRLFNALADLDNTGFTIKALNLAKKWLTFGVTVSPAFRIRNLMRDTMHTWALMGKVNLVDVAKAMKDVYKESDDWVDLMSMGGALTGSYYRADNPKAIEKEIDTKRKGHTKLGAAWRWWEKIGEAAENANRLALYRRLKMEGASDFDAAFEARDLLDFSAHGKNGLARFLISIVPFMNARLQGLHKIKRQASGPDRAKLIMRGAAVATASVVLHALNLAMQSDDDPWYDELPESDRWLYWHFGKHIALPKPFELGAVFGELPVQIMDSIYRQIAKDDPEAFKDLWAFSTFTLTETFNLNPLGQGMILVEQLANKDFFRNRPIVDIGLQGVDADLQWDYRSSKFSRELGEAIKFSPKRIDHLVEKTFGFAGQAAVAAFDHAVAPWMSNYPTDPALTVDSFYWLHGRIPRGDARYIKQEHEFYDLFSEVDQAMSSYKKIKELDRSKAKEYRKEHRAEFKVEGLMDSVKKRLSKLKKREQEIYLDTKLSAEEKREELDDLTNKRHEIIKRKLDRIKERYYE